MTRVGSHNRGLSARQCRRGGALYVTVFSTAIIVSMLGITGLTLVRLDQKRIDSDRDLIRARQNARSAVELAIETLQNDSNWRSNHSNGVETTPLSIGDAGAGTVSWVLRDSDGSLLDSDTDLRLEGIGRVGDAVQVSSVSLKSALADVGPVQLESNEAGGFAFDEVYDAKWWAEHIVPPLPANATEWKVTSVEFSLAKNGSPTQTLNVNLYLPGGDMLPETLIDSAVVAESDLPNSQTWYTIEFSGHSGLDPSTGVCVSLECVTSKKAAWLHYISGGDANPNTWMITGSQSGGWTTLEANKSLIFRLHGTYRAPTGVGFVEGSWQTADAP